MTGERVGERTSERAKELRLRGREAGEDRDDGKKKSLREAKWK